MSLHEEVFEMLAYALNEPEQPTDEKLHGALRLLCKYRAQLIGNTLVHQRGTEVRSGPFAGLVLPPGAAEGCYVPKLLGTYEQELHAILRSMRERKYDVVVNVGCAEGYYAVGMARLLGGVSVDAYDIDPVAREVCRETADANGVGDRITIGERFALSDFARYEGKRVCVICDIEGAELELMDPAAAPALRRMDALIEVHDVFAPGCSETLLERFESSHRVQRIPSRVRQMGDFEELEPFEDLDHLLALWEWRPPGNDWMWLEAKEP